MTNEEQIEEILTEASAFGLRFEVLQTANDYIAEGWELILAYQMAFDEWVK